MPKFEKRGLQVGRDFYLVFSPEREDPGNQRYNTKNIPKVVGGITSVCAKAGQALYSQIIDKVVVVSSTEVAEFTKLLENIFRSVNIALVNELKILADMMGIDVWETSQVHLAENNPEKLKREFGRDLCLWGGGCDTQRVLPGATPAEVAEDVRRRVSILAPGAWAASTPA